MAEVVHSIGTEFVDIQAVEDGHKVGPVDHFALDKVYPYYSIKKPCWLLDFDEINKGSAAQW